MGNTHFEKVSFERFLRACRQSDSTCGLRTAKEEVVRDVYNLIQLPRRATSGSAGYDFYVPYPCSFTPGVPTFIPTGIRVFLEPNQFLMCVPRSGLGFKYGARLKNSVGVIDFDFVFTDSEGQIMAKIDCDEPFSLLAGDRFMQGIILNYGITNDDNPIKSERTGGFGSTGGTGA